MSLSEWMTEQSMGGTNIALSCKRQKAMEIKLIHIIKHFFAFVELPINTFYK